MHDGYCYGDYRRIGAVITRWLLLWLLQAYWYCNYYSHCIAGLLQSTGGRRMRRRAASDEAADAWGVGGLYRCLYKCLWEVRARATEACGATVCCARARATEACVWRKLCARARATGAMVLLVLWCCYKPLGGQAEQKW